MSKRIVVPRVRAENALFNASIYSSKSNQYVETWLLSTKRSRGIRYLSDLFGIDLP